MAKKNSMIWILAIVAIGVILFMNSGGFQKIGTQSVDAYNFRLSSYFPSSTGLMAVTTLASFTGIEYQCADVGTYKDVAIGATEIFTCNSDACHLVIAKSDWSGTISFTDIRAMGNSGESTEWILRTISGESKIEMKKGVTFKVITSNQLLHVGMFNCVPPIEICGDWIHKGCGSATTVKSTTCNCKYDEMLNIDLCQCVCVPDRSCLISCTSSSTCAETEKCINTACIRLACTSGQIIVNHECITKGTKTCYKCVGTTVSKKTNQITCPSDYQEAELTATDCGAAPGTKICYACLGTVLDTETGVSACSKGYKEAATPPICGGQITCYKCPFDGLEPITLQAATCPSDYSSEKLICGGTLTCYKCENAELLTQSNVKECATGFSTTKPTCGGGPGIWTYVIIGGVVLGALVLVGSMFGKKKPVYFKRRR